VWDGHKPIVGFRESWSAPPSPHNFPRFGGTHDHLSRFFAASGHFSRSLEPRLEHDYRRSCARVFFASQRGDRPNAVSGVTFFFSGFYAMQGVPFPLTTSVTRINPDPEINHSVSTRESGLPLPTASSSLLFLLSGWILFASERMRACAAIDP